MKSQVIGPGAFKEVDLASAFAPVAEWSQTVLRPENATELAALAMKHALVERDVAHLIFPDEVQELPGVEAPVARPRAGGVAAPEIGPPEAELAEAVTLLSGAEKPVVIVGAGARGYGDDVVALSEHLDAPVVTTFKAKGLVPDDHPLAFGVLGRSGIPVASMHMGRADCLLVLGASFSDHTGIATYVPAVQVDFDRMMLGKVHPVAVPLWVEIGRTLALLRAAVPAASHVAARVGGSPVVAVAGREGSPVVAGRRARAHASGPRLRRAGRRRPRGRRHRRRRGQQRVFVRSLLRDPAGPVGHHVRLSGSIGFGVPTAMEAWAATGARSCR